MFRMGLPELVIMLVIVFFLCGTRLVPRRDTSEEGTVPTFNKRVFLGLGAALATFVLVEFLLSLD